MATAVFYVSSHGFGHATRVIALVRALQTVGPKNLNIVIRTEVPGWLFADELHGIAYSRAAIDVGMIQPNGLDIDLPASLAAHEAFIAQWDSVFQREASWLREAGATLVIGDVPPISFAAAEKAGVRSVAVANFSWDWIAGQYAREDPRWAPIAERYASAYASAGTLFRVPLSCPMPVFKNISDAPLLARRSTATRETTRAKLGLPPKERRRLTLVSFGGYGTGDIRFDDSDDYSGFLFAGFSAKPRGLRGDWIAIPQRTPIPHVDLLAAADAAIVKPGYGTCSEALAHRVRTLYVPRENFPEIPFLVKSFEALACTRPLSREDFYKGHWRGALENLFAIQDGWRDIPLDGAETIATRLSDLLT